MENVVTLAKWLRLGRQRLAIAMALRKPMIPSEICAGAQLINPRIQLRDLWFILPQLKNRKLVRCHVRNRTNGALYSLTDLGRAVVAAEFGIEHPATPRNIPWKNYSWVARARSRRVVLDGLSRLTARTGMAQTATELRRFLRRDHPLGLNVVLRTLHDALPRKLAVCVGENQFGRRLYQLTPAGERIIAQLRV